MTATLSALPREERGKNAMRRLRSEGLVPAVLYGHRDATQALSVSAQELDKLLGLISVENTIIDLAIDGGTPTSTLVREIQRHPSRRIVQHIDFLQIHAGEKISLEIPVRLHGTPVGVRDNGGILQEVLRELHVECLPRDIPEAIDIEIADLDIGGSVHVRDIEIANVKILNDEDLVIASVLPPTVVSLPETEDGEDAVGEPEVIGQTPDEPEE